MVAEACRGGLDREGTLPVGGGSESDQRGVKCTAVALINFPPLIVGSRLLRLLGLTRENSPAHWLFSRFDPFAAPQTADFVIMYAVRQDENLCSRKKYFVPVNLNSSV